jgi:hypothetical protein
VRLVVRPRVGDTLHLQVEQSVSVSGRRVEGASSSVPPVLQGKRGSSPAPDYGPRVDRANARITRVQLFAHSFVESSNMHMTTLVATTDSVTTWSGYAADGGRPMAMTVPEDGRQVRVQVTPDGAMRVTDPPPGAMQLGSTLASVPGLLPDGPVTVGTTWTRAMMLPTLPETGFRTDGMVEARLRLDSLSRDGRMAWISLTGMLRRDGAVREMPAGTRVITAGTISGVMVVDRDRAWIMDARTVVDVQSEVAPGPAARGQPLLLDMRIEQHVRVR